MVVCGVIKNFSVLLINKFLHTRVLGWVVVLRDSAWVVCMARTVPCDWFCQVWGVVRVNDKLKQGVRIACALFGNKFLFLVREFYAESFTRN